MPRDFKVRSLSICVAQAASSSGPKSFIFTICYWWKRLYTKRDLETQIRELIPSTWPHYKDKRHSITCPLPPDIHDQYRTAGLGITPCYHVLCLPGFPSTRFTCAPFIMSFYCTYKHSHYITCKYMTAAPQVGLLMAPSQSRGSGSFLGRSLGEFMLGELALREVPLCALRFLLWIIIQPMIHIHSSVTMR
jgi:hypothetical protein